MDASMNVKLNAVTLRDGRTVPWAVASPRPWQKKP